MFEQTAAQMERERIPGSHGDGHDLAGDRSEGRRDDRNHDGLVDHARFEIGGEAMMVGIMRVRMETLVHPWRRCDHRNDKNLHEGKPHHRRESAHPSVLAISLCHLGASSSPISEGKQLYTDKR